MAPWLGALPVRGLKTALEPGVNKPCRVTLRYRGKRKDLANGFFEEGWNRGMTRPLSGAGLMRKDGVIGMDYVRVEWSGRELVYPKGTLLSEIAAGLGVENALAAKLNGVVLDLGRPLEDGGALSFVSFDDEEGRLVYRHSSSHILAQAVKRLFPGVKLGIGPAVEEGFYYDFDPPVSFSPDDFPRIEAEMRSIIAADYPFVRREVTREEALALFRGRGETYKVELIENLPENATITVYQQGEFIDLCTGPHVPSTGYIGAVKVLSLAGAYWRGDERNKMLQRIYGISFPNARDLEEYLRRIEEAKRRDHRRLGREMDIFSLHGEGPGFPFFHPRGMVLRNELEEFWRKEHRKEGYLEVKTPLILTRSLWEQSGHWEHYRENMYFTVIDGVDYAIKPMNCPGAILIYKSRQHSYRELPLRLAELGLVHRHELSGVLHGLLRVRAFTQDDAHIFMLPSQITSEVGKVIDLVDRFYRLFGFSYHVELSTRPENAMGSPEIWEQATRALREVLDKKGFSYKVNEGEGAFYGPKVDFHLRDSLGRTWQCGTVQLDFLMPEKFDLTYIGEDGKTHRPVMVHRVIFGSLERFIGILIEHYGGAFPVWLAPIQVKVLPITDNHHGYAELISEKMSEEGLRVEVDWRNEKIGYKIREAELERVPYMVVVGNREAATGTVAIRKRRVGDVGTMQLDEFIVMVKEEIRNKTNTSC